MVGLSGKPSSPETLWNFDSLPSSRIQPSFRPGMPGEQRLCRDPSEGPSEGGHGLLLRHSCFSLIPVMGATHIVLELAASLWPSIKASLQLWLH